MQVGEIVKRKGYITRYSFVRRKTGPQLEKLVGYKAGSMGFGWALLFLTRLPGPGDFEFRGYTHLMDGVPASFRDLPERKDCEVMLQQAGADLEALKRRIIRDVFRLTGSDRLVKVVPNKDMDSKSYRIGAGIPQWELTARLPFKVAALIPPEGRNWAGPGDLEA